MFFCRISMLEQRYTTLRNVAFAGWNASILRQEYTLLVFN